MPLADVPQPSAGHAVPQNIMDVEFKLIGDLTMRQFAYLLVFGIASYLSTVIVIGLVKWVVAGVLAFLAIGLAFVPVQERGMDEWIANFVRSVYSPTQRVWKKEPTVPSAFLYDSLAVVKQELITLAPTSSRRKLEEYLKYQDEETSVDPLDIPERLYVRKVHEAYAATGTQVSTDVGVLAPPALGVSDFNAFQQPQPQPEPQVQTDETPNQDLPKENYENVQNEESLPSMTEPTTEQKPVEEHKTPESGANSDFSAKPEPDTFSELKNPAEDAVSAPDSPQSQGNSGVNAQDKLGDQVAHDSQSDQTTIITRSFAAPVLTSSPSVPTNARVAQPQPQTQPQPQRRKSILQETGLTRSDPGTLSGFTPMTPDTHSGRPFVNLLPSSGELILPIRGERVIRTSNEVDIEKEIKEKTEKLQELLRNIKEREGIKTETPVKPVVSSPEVAPQVAQTKEVGQEAQGIITRLQSQNEELNREIQSLKDEIGKAATISKPTFDQEDLLKKLENQRDTISSSYEQLNRQISDLQFKLKEKGLPDNIVTQPTFARMQPMTSQANVISGIVKTLEGKGVDSVLIILKNSRNEPVRAFKSNSLGQFMLTSPLGSGVYTIEVSSLDENHLTFDKISVELKGDIVPPLEIIGK